MGDTVGGIWFKLSSYNRCLWQLGRSNTALWSHCSP